MGSDPWIRQRCESDERLLQQSTLRAVERRIGGERTRGEERKNGERADRAQNCT